MKLLCRKIKHKLWSFEGKKNSFFLANERASLRKLFYCDVHISICAQHAKSKSSVYKRRRRRSSSSVFEREREREKVLRSLYIIFYLHSCWWNIHETRVPCFSMECAALPIVVFRVRLGCISVLSSQLFRSVESEHILSPTVWVSLFVGFPSSSSSRPLLLVSTVLSVLCVHFTNSSEGRKGKEGRKERRKKKENSQRTWKGRKRSASNSQRFFEITFFVFFIFLFSLSVVCEHFVDLEQPSDICCTSRHHSFSHSFHSFFK